MNKQLFPVILAAWLFIPPVFFPAASVQAQQPAVQTVAPRIDRFDLDPPRRLVPGESLIFRITGSPFCSASVKIGGVKGKVDLRETMVGVYEGVYTIRKGDEIVGDSIVMGVLRRSTAEITAVLDQPLVEPARVAISR